MKDLRAIILAAGKGTRMKSDVPKVLHKVCGKPIVRYVLDLVKVVGSLKTYIVLGYKSEVVEKCLDKDIIPVKQHKQIGTADAIKQVEGRLRNYNGDVLVLCGDTPLLTARTVRELVRKHKKTDAVCTFLSAIVHDPQGYGRVIRSEKGYAVAIREDKDAVGYERDIAEINVGVYCFKSKDLYKALKKIKLNKKKKEFYLTDIIELYTSSGLKVETIETEDVFEGLGVNSREDLSVAESVVKKKIISNFMLQGVTIVDPSTTYIDSNVKIGKDVTIRPFTCIEENVRIGDNCLIGPFSRIRSGCKIGNKVEIGNFTEVSRSKIGNGSVVKHVSFLGDALIGQDVNIGAGTITANYNGKDKNQTVISDKAFIGADSILIAPVKIGKKAVVGAGSVVTKRKNVPEGGIVVGVPAKIVSRRKR